jgi:hypothetical protein
MARFSQQHITERNGKHKTVPLGELIQEKILTLSILKTRHRGIQKTYTWMHFSQTVFCRKKKAYKKCSSCRNNPMKITDIFLFKELGTWVSKKYTMVHFSQTAHCTKSGKDKKCSSWRHSPGEKNDFSISTIRHRGVQNTYSMACHKKMENTRKKISSSKDRLKNLPIFCFEN